MSDKSSIEWTDATWPIVVGCTKVSAGCENCYAIRDAHRMGANPEPKISSVYGGLTVKRPDGSLNWAGVVRPVPARLEWPVHWHKPRRIFTTSQADLFHKDVPDAFIAEVFAVMAACKQHTFQVLTKRPEHAAVLLAEDHPTFGDLVDAAMARRAAERGWCVDEVDEWPLPNVWLGTSVEHQDAADERIPHLLATPAAVRFLSCEPLLGPVDLEHIQHQSTFELNALAGTHGVTRPHKGTCARVDWVIAGGESGHGARPMHPDWARSLRDQCQAAGVAFHFKQWGNWAPGMVYTMAGEQRVEHRFPDDTYMRNVGKKAAGRELDGRTWDEFPNPLAGIFG